MSEETKEARESYLQEYERDKERKEEAWRHTEKAMSQECIKWDRDYKHWENIQEHHAATISNVKLTNKVNIILAACSIIGAVCTVIRTRRHG